MNIVFGAGAFWKEYAYWLKKIFNIDFVCDNDKSKLGKVFDELTCLSIADINEKDNVYVGVENRDAHETICALLKTKSIEAAALAPIKNRGPKLYLFGTLKECRIYDWLITCYSDYDIVGYVTHQVEIIGMDIINNKPIISVAKAEKQLRNNIVDGIVVLTDTYSYDGVTRKMFQEDILMKPTFYVAPFRYLKSLKEKNFDIYDILIAYRDARRLGVIQFMVTPRCNLNCKLCSHFSALVDENEQYSLEEFSEDLDIISRDFQVDTVDIWGGEALLVKDLKKYLLLTREKFPYSKIDIGTNGLLIMRMNEELINAIKQVDARLVISMYKPTLNMIEQIVEFLNSHMIRWTKAGNENCIDAFWRRYCEDGNNSPSDSYRFCTSKYCPTVYRGKVSGCYFPHVAKFYNDYYDEEIFKTYQDVVSVDKARERYSELFRCPMQSCKYCGPLHTEEWTLVKGETKGNKDNWVYL